MVKFGRELVPPASTASLANGLQLQFQIVAQTHHGRESCSLSPPSNDPILEDKVVNIPLSTYSLTAHVMATLM